MPCPLRATVLGTQHGCRVINAYWTSNVSDECYGQLGDCILGRWQSQDRTGSDRIGSDRIGSTKLGPDQ